MIVTFHAPADAAYDFKRFYDAVKARGFILYPGKLTEIETFRVGCIGAITPDDMRRAVAAVAGALRDLGIGSGLPALLAQTVIPNSHTEVIPLSHEGRHLAP